MELCGVDGVEMERAVTVHRPGEQRRVREIAGEIHLAGDAAVRQRADSKPVAQRVYACAAVRDADKVRRAGNCVQIGAVSPENVRGGVHEAAAGLIERGIAHRIGVELQQAQAVAREGRLISGGLQHGKLSGRGVEDRGAAFAAVGREEELNGHPAALRVEGGNVKYPQIGRQRDAAPLAACDVLTAEDTVAQIVVGARVVGEEAVHVVGHCAADVGQRGAEEAPCAVVAGIERESAVGEGLRLDAPDAVQRDLAAYCVGVDVNELHGRALGLVVRRAYV